jgi:hypothetical protein
MTGISASMIRAVPADRETGSYERAPSHLEFSTGNRLSKWQESQPAGAENHNYVHESSDQLRDSAREHKPYVCCFARNHHGKSSEELLTISKVEGYGHGIPASLW